MTCKLRGGPRSFGGGRTAEGHREYTLSFLVEAEPMDGPYNIMHTPGLPEVGSEWDFGNAGFSGAVSGTSDGSGEIDEWAFCLPELKIRPHEAKEGEASRFYTVECKYSTNAAKFNQRCQDLEIGDPCLEPPKISGGFTTRSKKLTHNRQGEMIRTSSWEVPEGTEVDVGLPTVSIQQNVLTLGLSTFSTMINTVNDDTLWGLPKRFIKLVNAPWERKMYGKCTYYYTRTFEFEIDNETRDKDGNYIGFDRQYVNQGEMVLAGHWEQASSNAPWIWYDELFYPTVGPDPNPANPLHFKRYVDRDGNLARTYLDINGRPLFEDEEPVIWVEELFHESNFLLLGVPITL
ncbi:MAG: hypothetical protein WC485_00110 [Opitutaceae bacterium]